MSKMDYAELLKKAKEELHNIVDRELFQPGKSLYDIFIIKAKF